MNSPADRVDWTAHATESAAPEHDYVEGFATNLYHDRNFDVPAAKILPGEYFVTTQDMMLVTVLGSCVAACIRDNRKGIGGMNHFMLPEDSGGDVVSNSARFGVYAMEILINHLLKSGARRNHLEAKVFGGGRVLDGLTKSRVGERNAEFVLKFLKTEKVPVVAKDLLDSYPRKVYYFPRDGRVLVRKLHRVHNDTLFNRETEYRARIEHSKLEGDIELFS